jgi:hypothetical protein
MHKQITPDLQRSCRNATNVSLAPCFKVLPVFTTSFWWDPLSSPTTMGYHDLPTTSGRRQEGGDRVSCHRGKVITDFEDYNTSIYLVSDECRNSALKPFVTNIFHLDGLICNANPSRQPSARIFS